MPTTLPPTTLIRWMRDLRRHDVPDVGGKNASLGELLHELQAIGIRVPDGFATTAAAYWLFLDANRLRPVVAEQISALHDGRPLSEVGAAIRAAMCRGVLPDDLTTRLDACYRTLSGVDGDAVRDVAVRSSATAEDLPEASFAGQQETFLNVRGHEALHDAVRRCFASLFTDRAIAYREAQGFDHLKVALSVGVQVMVRSDLASAGVLFTLDTDSGFPRVIHIDAAWGLGESVVSGAVDPDSYTVFTPLLDDRSVRPIIDKHLGEKAVRVVCTDDPDRPTATEATSEEDRRAWVLSDREILQLARWGRAIARHYGCPMDIEWAKDGPTSQLFIVQARPETVQSRTSDAALATYHLNGTGDIRVSGLAIGDAIAAGPAIVLHDPAEIARFTDGAILVTGKTDPDWVPIMKRAAAIVTDHGGRTAHAAIISRELGIPAVVGTGDATAVLADGDPLTVSCAEGETGRVYDGILPYERLVLDLHDLPATRTALMLNVANPAAALRWWRLPTRGIGLARIEFIVSNHVGVHPLALTRFASLEDQTVKARIAELTEGYQPRTEYFVDRLAQGIARLAASQWPEPVTVRMSDFKTSEYAALLGGAQFEPFEENPMLGFRGASRYHSPRYADGFALECRAILRVRDTMGMRNVRIMIPFVRTLDEADDVLDVLALNGLTRGEDGLEIWMMAEIPSNVILAAEFAMRFDGFSIGSNDLTQLVLGIDRDSSELAPLFDERNEAVMRMIRQLVDAGHASGIPVGICGQAPSDHPDFAAFLVEIGIDSISLNPDSFLTVLQSVRAAEDAGGPRPAERAPIPS